MINDIENIEPALANEEVRFTVYYTETSTPNSYSCSILLRPRPAAVFNVIPSRASFINIVCLRPN